MPMWCRLWSDIHGGILTTLPLIDWTKLENVWPHTTNSWTNSLATVGRGGGAVYLAWLSLWDLHFTFVINKDIKLWSLSSIKWWSLATTTCTLALAGELHEMYTNDVATNIHVHVDWSSTGSNGAGLFQGLWRLFYLKRRAPCFQGCFHQCSNP